MKVRVLLYVAVALIIAMIVYVDHELDKRITVPEEGRIFLIESGSSVRSVIAKLATSGIIETSPIVTRAYGLANRFMGTIKAGEYRLMPDMNLREVLALFRSGKVAERQITFVEGWRFSQWREHLGSHDHVKQTLDGHNDFAIMKLLGKAGVHPEGQFFPDTYHFPAGETDISILRRAHQRMQQILQTEWQRRSAGSLLESSYEVLILASIVEKETGYQPDRPRIARVFINRLELNMRLQSDPTVIYGLDERFDGDLLRVHLKDNSPYNTYQHRGLPPTPISNPGRPAIRAVVQPAAGDYLYFVAKGDGTSHFSSTLAEHNEAVTRYQKSGRVENYRSVPGVEQ